MADISKITLPSGESYNLKDVKAARYEEIGGEVSIEGKEPLYKDVEYKDLTTEHKTIIAAINDAANSGGGESSEMAKRITDLETEVGSDTTTGSIKGRIKVLEDSCNFSAITNTEIDDLFKTT